MKALEVFDPAMCCSTGVCGPSVDPKLARFTGDLAWLADSGVSVQRYNLALQPEAFAERAEVAEILRAKCLSPGREPASSPFALLTPSGSQSGGIVAPLYGGRFGSTTEPTRLPGVSRSGAANTLCVRFAPGRPLGSATPTLVIGCRLSSDRAAW